MDRDSCAVRKPVKSKPGDDDAEAFGADVSTAVPDDDDDGVDHSSITWSEDPSVACPVVMASKDVRCIETPLESESKFVADDVLSKLDQDTIDMMEMSVLPWLDFKTGKVYAAEECIIYMTGAIIGSVACSC